MMRNANEAESGSNILLNSKVLSAPFLSEKVEFHFLGRKIIPKVTPRLWNLIGGVTRNSALQG